METKFLQQIEQVDATSWDAQFASDYPFTKHAFLRALETSGSVAPKTGWTPRHLLVLDSDRVLAGMPCYLKQHSYGEYVFDWAWADAYRRYGVDYYPKLITAIPFTPATGPRISNGGGTETIPSTAVLSTITTAIHTQLAELDGSSWHGYFPTQALSEAWQKQSWMQRKGVQYHWFNREYRDFDDFLEAFNSRKRKNLRKERRRVHEQGLELVRREGTTLTTEDMAQFYRFYQATYLKRSGNGGYLSHDFFEQIRQTMPQHIMMVGAYRDDRLIAAALNFKDSRTLYGRYWGCLEDFECLHFEACYYQGIEYCIEKGLQRFDPGAQGEHKIQRGFEPIATWSNHYIRHPEFRAAIEHFIEQENQHVSAYIEQARHLLPFKTR